MPDVAPKSIRGKLKGSTLIIIAVVIIVLYVWWHRKKQQETAAAAAADIQDQYDATPAQGALGDLYSPYSNYPYSPAGFASAGAYSSPNPAGSANPPAAGATANVTPPGVVATPGTSSSVPGLIDPIRTPRPTTDLPPNTPTTAQSLAASGLSPADLAAQAAGLNLSGTYLYGSGPDSLFIANGFVKMQGPDGRLWWAGPESLMRTTPGFTVVP